MPAIQTDRRLRVPSSWPRVRRKLAWIGVLLGSLVAVEGSVRATDASDGAQFLVPCVPATPGHTAASDGLTQLSAQIAALDRTAKVSAVLRQLNDLRRSNCFAASADALAPEPFTKSVGALKLWWREGGESWLRSYLQADQGGRLREVVLPPDMPRSIAPGDAYGWKVHPWLATLRCPADKTPARTAGKPGDEARAAVGPGLCPDLDAQKSRDRLEAYLMARPFVDCQPAPPEALAQRCAFTATKDGDYPTWRRCLQDRRDRFITLPLGGVKSPTVGWLSLAGSGGADMAPGCRRTRHFDLQSGSAHVIDDCPAPQGAGRVESVSRGRVDVGLLREVALVVALVDGLTLDTAAAQSERLPVPEGMAVRWPTPARFARGEETGVQGCLGSFSAHATRVQWRWQPARGAATRGSFSDNQPAGAHALERLARVQASFVVDPKALPLPRRVGRLPGRASESRP